MLLTWKTEHRFGFKIGPGSAGLEVESFDGDVRLCCPGQVSKDDEEEERSCGGERRGQALKYARGSDPAR